MRAKVAIVGGGVMGTSIALHLARRLDPLSQPVVLLERAAQLGAGSSGRSGAVLRQHYADPQVARMARDSLAVYAGFEERTGRSVGFRRTGVLTLAGPGAPEWIERVRANVAMLVSIGVDTRLVDAREICALVPGIAVSDGTVGAWEPGGGFADPALTLEAFSAVARMHGAVTRTATDVLALAVEAGRVVGVETKAGRVAADAVVVAAGPWSHTLLARAGVGLPLRAVRPEQYFIAMPGRCRSPSEERGRGESRLEEPLERLEREAHERAQSEPASAHPVLIDLEHGFYTRCEPVRARTRVGRIDYAHDDVLDDPDQLDEVVGEEMLRWGRARLEERLPVYAEEPDRDAQAAWYTLTPDSQPLLGPVPEIDGLFVATGFSGHGFKLAPSIGEGMTQLLLGDRVTAFDREFFSPQRFADERATFGRGAFGL